MNFWDYSVWGFFNLVTVLLFALIIANILKKHIKFFQASLIPTSVLAGLGILIISTIYKAITKNHMFDVRAFNYAGTANLEIITFHCLAFGFIAMAFSSKKKKLSKKRTAEIFNTGVTTVATYLLQGVLGMVVTLLAAKFVTGLISGAGILLPFGYGQGTGQALNFGSLFENDHGFTGGKNFGLSVAALGFLSASIGGVIHLNIMKAKGKIQILSKDNAEPTPEENSAEEPQKEKKFINGGLEDLSIQISTIFITYMLAYFLIAFLGNLLPGFKSVLYGFNFLIGVLVASLIKLILNGMKKANIIDEDYINPEQMDKLGSFFFDLMIVTGIAAIQLDLLKDYWPTLLVMGLLGLLITYIYNRFVAKVLFPEYAEAQFLVMYGMLTGTASTGVILLREIDKDFVTPAADNLVYQNFPAIVFGFPMMVLGALAPVEPVKTLIILAAFFVVMNIILFRRQIFLRGRNKE
ncbi:MAG: hypothetical protein MJ181_10540 [Treponema sp.]|nr:hypothetical protein [Treponema sp.]